MPPFILRTFGSLSLHEPSGAVIPGTSSQRRRLALLAVLAASGAQGRSRESLLGLLWPDSPPERARHSLQQLVYGIRTSVDNDAILGVNPIVLNPDAIRSDVLEFERALAEDRVADAVATYRGPFLEGFVLPDAIEFDQWAGAERAHRAAAYAGALEKLAAAAEHRLDWRSAVAWWEKRAAHDPFDSRVAQSLMRALDASGNRAGAILHAAAHERLLREELGVRSSTAVSALAERMRTVPPPPSAAAPFDAASGAVPKPPAPVEAAAAPSVAPGEVPPIASPSGGASARRAPRSRRAGARWLALVGLGVIAALAWGRRPAAPVPERSIAVLPFVDLSPRGDNEYFSDGITEEITTQLAAIPELKVISRTSAMHYKESTEPLRRIAAELGVAHVLEGSIRREGDSIRVTAQLIDAGADRHLWSRSYDHQVVNVLAVQDTIAREVARALAVTLRGGGPPSRGTRDPQAYELYLRGRYQWQKRTKEGHEQAIEYFRRAIERDSTYADAYAGLAVVYLTGYAQYIPGFADREAETYANLKWAAERSVALDDNSALSHRALGILLVWQRDWPGAERELRHTLELNPGDSQARNWYSAVLGMRGQVEDALRESRRAYELDPFNLTNSGNVADQLVLARRYDLAIDQLRKTLEIEPAYPFAHRTLGVLYAHTGRYAEAERELRRVAAEASYILDFRADLAYVLAVEGKRAEAARIVRELEALPDDTRKRDAAFSIGRAYVALGQPDSAFAWLDRADWRWPHRGNRFDPALDPIRADPRFARLSARVDREMGVR